MTRKVKNAKSPEQRRAEAEELHNTIAAKVEAMRDSEEWARFIRFAQSFHRYSLGNLLLIWAQMPEATHVAGYRSWQARGRQVRKGEKGMRIFGGRRVTYTETNPRTGEDEEKDGMRFFPVSVFDISQTDVTDPEKGEVPEVAHRLIGEDAAGIFDAVADYLTGKGWSVTRETITGEVNGYTTMDGSRRVVIRDDVTPAQAAKTALHEAAHVILHSEDAPGEYVEHRGTKETEAESVAFIVAGILGMDTSAYSVGYVTGWSNQKPEAIKETAARVLKAAHHLTEAITEE